MHLVCIQTIVVHSDFINLNIDVLLIFVQIVSLGSGKLCKSLDAFEIDLIHSERFLAVCHAKMFWAHCVFVQLQT